MTVGPVPHSKYREDAKLDSLKARPLRILVYPHELEMGGSQINAIELAAAIRDLGHEVHIFATQGPLLSKIHELNLPFIEAPKNKNRIGIRSALKLKKTIRELAIDVVHPYEWTAIVNTTLGLGLIPHTKIVMTVLSMDVPDFLPRHFPLIVGTQNLAKLEKAKRSYVHVLEPPIDASANRPQGTTPSRLQLGIGPDELVVSIVGRLTTDLDKLDGVKTAILVAEKLAHKYPITLLVAGDGPGFPEVMELAKNVNERIGKNVVRVKGSVIDPRPIYDSADIVLGMGSSAMRGMAHSKPLIVQGESGFWKLASPSTQEEFLENGWFGLSGAGEADLEEALLLLLENPEQRLHLGSFGRNLIEETFSLPTMAQRLLDIYESEINTAAQPKAEIKSSLRTGLETCKFLIVTNPKVRLFFKTMSRVRA